MDDKTVEKMQKDLGVLLQAAGILASEMTDEEKKDILQKELRHDASMRDLEDSAKYRNEMRAHLLKINDLTERQTKALEVIARALSARV